MPEATHHRILRWASYAAFAGCYVFATVWITQSERVGGSALRSVLTGAGVNAVVDDWGQAHAVPPDQFRLLLIGEVGTFVVWGALFLFIVLSSPAGKNLRD